MTRPGPLRTLPALVPSARIARIRRTLLKWYRANRRDLPWRRTHDPYAVWVSEVMLQQTRVDTVIPYYERFLERWPTVQALHAADPDDVRAAWSGLGYYRRARLMLEAAASVVRDHDGRFPPDLQALRALPGFGRYTAGAVASIAFDLEAPVVDGNVARLLARVEGIEGDVSRGDGQRAVWSAAEVLAPGKSAGDLTQAMIELGALVCSPKSPGCDRCPLAADCAAHRDGSTDRIPPPKKRAKRKRLDVTALVAADEDSVVLERQPESGLFGSLWCLPLLEGALDPDAAADEAARKYEWNVEPARQVGAFLHVLTHRDLHVRLMRVQGTPEPTANLRRVAVAELASLGLPSVTVRALEASLPRALLSRASLPRRRTRARDDAQPALPWGPARLADAEDL